MKVEGKIQIADFRRIILGHYHLHGRHHLPWRKTKNPYRILVSEFMLQQTQVSRVIPKYASFLKKFPNIQELANGGLAGVIKEWQGLGYNRRAINLYRLANIVIKQHKGKIPRDRKSLMDLPGVGQSTAGAIMSFGFNMPVVFIETNIRRAFIYYCFRSASKKVLDVDVLSFIEKTLDRKNPREWYYALMDYGAMLGMKEKNNPNKKSISYRTQSRFVGSVRKVRGAIVKNLSMHRVISRSTLSRLSKDDDGDFSSRFERAISGLLRDGLVVRNGAKISLTK